MLSDYGVEVIQNLLAEIADDVGSSSVLNHIAVEHEIVDGRIDDSPKRGAFKFYVGMSHA